MEYPKAHIMARQVLLPSDIGIRLHNLTALVEEVNGILLYKRIADNCPLEAMFVTGVGNAGHVQALPERAEIANEFFRRNTDYQFVKFHTHTAETIRKFGDYYARNLSKGDIDLIKAHLKEDKEFMTLLITPETKILCGIDNPKLVMINDFPGYKEKSYRVGEEIKNIAKQKGYNLDGLLATRK